MSALAHKLAARRSTLGPSALDSLLVEVNVNDEPTLPQTKLAKPGVYLRADHLAQLRGLRLELAIDGLDFSQNEMIRAAVASFLAMPLKDQHLALVRNRRDERARGVVVGR